MLQQTWQPGTSDIDLSLQGLAAEPAIKIPRIQPWEDSLQATHTSLFQQGFEQEQEDPLPLQQQVY